MSYLEPHNRNLDWTQIGLGDDPADLIIGRVSEQIHRAKSKMEMDSEIRYLFNAGRPIYIGDRRVGLNMIFRVRPNPVKNWIRLEESPLRYDEYSTEFFREGTQYADWTATELTEVYAKPQYVIELTPFRALPVELVDKLGRLLIPQFPKTINDLINSIKQSLSALKNDPKFVSAINELEFNYDVALCPACEEALIMMLEAASNVLVSLTDMLDVAIAERGNAENTGKTSYDIADKEIAILLGREADLVDRPPTPAEIMMAMQQNQQNGQNSQQNVVARPNKPLKECVYCYNDIDARAVLCQFCHRRLDTKEAKDLAKGLIPNSEGSEVSN